MTHAEWLAQIEKRVKAATPGPWVGYKKSILGRTKEQIGSWVSSAPINKEADRLFIAHSRTDIERLLACHKVMWEALEKAYYNELKPQDLLAKMKQVENLIQQGQVS